MSRRYNGVGVFFKPTGNLVTKAKGDSLETNEERKTKKS